MAKILITNTQVLEVCQNEDGSLFITADGENSIQNAGSFILNMGGIDKVLARCEEVECSFADFLSEYKVAKAAKREEDHKIAMAREAEAMQRYEDEYNALLSENGGVIPTTYENIGKVLRYLNTQNCGSWELPKMTIGYRCNQYDCDGKQASTMVLDEPINVSDDTRESRFQVGAPFGHLTKYYRA